MKHYMVRAIAAGSLLVAAALPAAVAAQAGAAGVAPTLTSVGSVSAGTLLTAPTATGAFTIAEAVTTGVYTLATTAGLTGQVAVGDTVTATGIGTAGGTALAQTMTIATVGGSAAAGSNPVAGTSGVTVTFSANTQSTNAIFTESATVAGTGALNPTGTGAYAATQTAAGAAITLSITGGTTSSSTIPAGTIISGTNIPLNDYLTTAVTATNAGVAGTLAVATTTALTGAATFNSPAVVPAFGEGSLSVGVASRTFLLSGTGFAADGGNASMLSSNPDLSFSVTELSSTLASVTVNTTAKTTSGSASITLKDNNGTSTALLSALNVTPDPTVTSLSSTSIANSQQNSALVITGTGFSGTPSVTFTNTTDGTTLNVVGTTLSVASSTTLTVNVKALNSVNLSPATVGAYTVTVTNTDGGSVITPAIFTVVASGVTNVSPSQIAIPTGSNVTNTTVTITGAGFEPSASVALATCTLVTATGVVNGVVTASTVVNSPTTITAVIQANASSTGLCTLTVTNPSVANGGNAAIFSATGALGIGQAATTAASITAVTVTPSAPIVVGSTGTTPVTMTITGSGFGASSTVSFLEGTTATADPSVSAVCTAATNGTSLTCAVSVASGATAGADGIAVVNSGTHMSNVFPNGIAISGPAITSALPASIAAAAPVGTVITLTGTGLNSTATIINMTGGLSGVFAVTSPTSATLALTSSPTAGAVSFSISEYVAYGVTVQSQAFKMLVNVAPTVSSLQNALLLPTVSGTVGAGAVNVPVTIVGTGFTPVVTIGSFTNAYGVADPGVTAKVVSVSTDGSTIKALVSIAAGDANISDGYTITNTDGGIAKVSGFTATTSLFISAGPTITSVTPVTVTPNSTVAFTIVGTGFNGTAVAPSANGTCGPTTVTGTVTLSVTCTFSAATASAVSLVVTNANGGSATSATVMAAATVVTPPVVTAVNLHTTGAHGFAVVGRTAVITITGGGFYGQPRLTSTAVGVRAIVAKDNGRMLTVRVTTTSVRARGWHTFTIRLANGKMAKVNYLTK